MGVSIKGRSDEFYRVLPGPPVSRTISVNTVANTTSSMPILCLRCLLSVSRRTGSAPRPSACYPCYCNSRSGFMQVFSANNLYFSGLIFQRSAIFSTILRLISLSLCLLSMMNCMRSASVSAPMAYFSSIPARHICLILSIRSLMESIVRSR